LSQILHQSNCFQVLKFVLSEHQQIVQVKSRVDASIVIGYWQNRQLDLIAHIYLQIFFEEKAVRYK